MLIGYARVSKADGSQSLDLQIDALLQASVDRAHIYTEKASGKKEDRPQLESCLKALRPGDTLVIWKLDRLGRNLKHLVTIVDALATKGIALKVLTGQGAHIDTSTPAGKMIFGIFAALAEFERELIRERTIEGLKAARARGRTGGRRCKLTKHQVMMIQVAVKDRNTNISQLCKELKITSATLYNYVSPNGDLRERGKRTLDQ